MVSEGLRLVFRLLMVARVSGETQTVRPRGVSVLLKSSLGEPDLWSGNRPRLLDDAVGQDRDTLALEGVEHSDLDAAFTTAQFEEAISERAGVRTAEPVALLGEEIQ